MKKIGRLLIVLCLSLLVACAFTACGDGTSKTMYTVTVNGGTGGDSYAAGTEITVTADEDQNNRFLGWKLEGESAYVSTEKSYTFVVEKDVELTAEFVDLYTVAVAGGTGANTYEKGASVTVTANEPTAGQRFVGWSDGAEIVSTDVQYTFTASKNVTLTAVFVNVYTVTVSGGTIQNSTDTSVAIDENGTVTVVAGEVPTGCRFVGWFDSNEDGAKALSTQTTYTHTVTSNVTLTAKYVNVYTVTVVGGAVEGSSATSATVDENGTITVVANRAPIGRSFVGWFDSNEDGATALSTETTYTHTVTADVTLTAKFAYIYTVSVVGGTVKNSTDTSASVDENDTVTVVSDTPNGYKFVGWYDSDADGAAALSTDTTYTYTVTGNVTLTAKFEQDETLEKKGDTYSDNSKFQNTACNFFYDELNLGYTVSHNSEAIYSATTTAQYTNCDIVFEIGRANHWVHPAPYFYFSLGTYIFQLDLLNHTASLMKNDNVIGSSFDHLYSDDGVQTRARYTIHYTTTSISMYVEEWNAESGTYGEKTLYAKAMFAEGNTIIPYNIVFTESGAAIELENFTVNYYEPKQEQGTDVYTVTVTGGIVKGGNTTSVTVAENGTVTVVASELPNGYKFVGWFDSDADDATALSTDVAYTHTVTGNVTLTARYEQDETLVEKADTYTDNSKFQDTACNFFYDEQSLGYTVSHGNGELVYSATTTAQYTNCDIVFEIGRANHWVHSAPYFQINFGEYAFKLDILNHTAFLMKNNDMVGSSFAHFYSDDGVQTRARYTIHYTTTSISMYVEEWNAESGTYGEKTLYAKVMFAEGNAITPYNIVFTESGAAIELENFTVTYYELPQVYTVTVAGGIVKGGNTTSVTVAENGTVTVVASELPNGYKFVGWFDSDADDATALSTDVAYTHTVTGNVTLTARYEQDETLVEKADTYTDNSKFQDTACNFFYDEQSLGYTVSHGNDELVYSATTTAEYTNCDIVFEIGRANNWSHPAPYFQINFGEYAFKLDILNHTASLMKGNEVIGNSFAHLYSDGGVQTRARYTIHYTTTSISMYVEEWNAESGTYGEKTLYAKVMFAEGNAITPYNIVFTESGAAIELENFTVTYYELPQA